MSGDDALQVPRLTYRTASLGLSRDLNRSAILRLIGSAGPIARRDIARRLGLSPATVTAVTRELVDHGFVRVAKRAPSRGGRPALLLEVVGGAAAAFGVKVAPDHLVGVRIDLEADVLDLYEAPFDAEATDAVEQLARTLAAWLDGPDERPPLLGVGLGVPGVFDSRSGTLESPLLGWSGVALPSLLQERLGVPVFVDNDVNTLAVAERLYGRGRDVEHFITVTLGRGVGLGIVAGGDIYRGHRGGAGEFGHVTVVDDGPACTCGKRGCLEAVVADPALVAEARRRRLLSSRQGLAALRKLAAGGDEEVLALYDHAGGVLGRAVSGLVNVLGPELVLVSGEGTESWMYLAAAFQRELRSNLFPPLQDVPVEVDPWDDVKWAVGAAALVLRATLTAPLDGEQPNESIRARVGAVVPTEVVA